MNEELQSIIEKQIIYNARQAMLDSIKNTNDIMFLKTEFAKTLHEKWQLQSRVDKAIEILESIPINADGGEILEVERKVLHILKVDDLITPVDELGWNDENN